MTAFGKGESIAQGSTTQSVCSAEPGPYQFGGLIDLVSNIALGDAKARSADVLGHVFEYFLGEFALAEGKKGGQFYTPRSVVELLVAMLVGSSWKRSRGPHA